MERGLLGPVLCRSHGHADGQGTSFLCYPADVLLRELVVACLQQGLVLGRAFPGDDLELAVEPQGGQQQGERGQLRVAVLSILQDKLGQPRRQLRRQLELRPDLPESLRQVQDPRLACVAIEHSIRSLNPVHSIQIRLQSHRPPRGRSELLLQVLDLRNVLPSLRRRGLLQIPNSPGEHVGLFFPMRARLSEVRIACTRRLLRPMVVLTARAQGRPLDVSARRRNFSVALFLLDGRVMDASQQPSLLSA
mmetsp:Transcript_66936/g.217795  ORF Transcript_66936/g.217795 Transcript_66936/m.217795 type:complete len:249 (-) Transcript_66936:925-1671(-)